MTINEIHKNEPLSVRSYNVCKYNGLETLKEIIKFYRDNKSFDKLRNCGKKSNKELTELYNKYKSIDFGFQEIYPVKFENKFKIIISELSRNQREIINSFIQINTNSLSIRSQNGIKGFLENNLNIKNFASKILFDHGFDAKKIKNIGTGSVSELNIYINIIEDFIIEVSKNESDKYLISLKNKFLIQNTFSLSNVPNGVLESESIFQLIDFLFNQNELNKLSVVDSAPNWQNREVKSKSSLKRTEINKLFNKRTSSFFQKVFKIYNEQPPLTLDEIAKEFNISRERARQLRKICLEELFSNLQFIKNIDDNLYQKYGIDTNQHIISVDDNLNILLNEINNTNFSNEFISYLIYVYISDKFDLIGNIEDVLPPKYFNSRNRHNWNNFYLVKKELVLEFDFISLANDISERLNERLEEMYSFSFKSYLSNFLINDNLEVLNSIMEIAEKIVNQEFEIYIDLEDNIVFERNSIKTLPEYIFETLEEIGKPSTVEVLYEFIENKHPGISKSSEALRGSCQRSDSLIYFGRSSTYGLKKWEIEMENIKGGTIKDIIAEFLKISDTPIHINEILNEVHKYRELTNERNIITNLKLDPSKDFIIYNQKFVGLKAKVEVYENDKYKNLPLQLGKIIIGLINRGVFQSKTTLAKYLEEKYLLTENETNNILLNLKITI